MSGTKFNPELPNFPETDVPPEYFDKFHLIFSHFNLDRKIVRIGQNERQRRNANSIRGNGANDYSWHDLRGVRVSRKTNNYQHTTISGKIPRSQNLLN